MFIRISDRLHREFKTKCAEKRLTMQSVVKDLLRIPPQLLLAPNVTGNKKVMIEMPDKTVCRAFKIEARKLGVSMNTAIANNIAVWVHNNH